MWSFTVGPRIRRGRRRILRHSDETHCTRRRTLGGLGISRQLLGPSPPKPAAAICWKVALLIQRDSAFCWAWSCAGAHSTTPRSRGFFRRDYLELLIWVPASARLKMKSESRRQGRTCWSTLCAERRGVLGGTEGSNPSRSATNLECERFFGEMRETGRPGKTISGAAVWLGSDGAHCCRLSSRPSNKGRTPVRA